MLGETLSVIPGQSRAGSKLRSSSTDAAERFSSTKVRVTVVVAAAWTIPKDSPMSPPDPPA
ncbi:MAG: hypothetical protein IPM79_13520 [Polyangiaceae bacterium]|nr:hypothetical protein [Polyangiaceae bacterium]